MRCFDFADAHDDRMAFAHVPEQTLDYLASKYNLKDIRMLVPLCISFYKEEW